jgi:lysozyme
MQGQNTELQQAPQRHMLKTWRSGKMDFGGNMNIQALKTQLAIDECDRFKPYDDATGKELRPGDTIKGNITIGRGRNLNGVGISKDELEYLNGNDIDKIVTQLDNLFPWWKQMSDKRQQVLANLCFNLGITKLAQFKNTLTAMQVGRYNDAADGMLASAWAKQTGARAQRLITMMREG